MGSLFTFNIYQTVENTAVLHELEIIKSNQQKIMASIAELSAKVDTLQTALDTEQEQIAAAIAALQQTVTDLNAIIAEGGTAEERQALSDKLDAVITDLQGTIPDA